MATIRDANVLIRALSVIIDMQDKGATIPVVLLLQPLAGDHDDAVARRRR